MTVIPLGPQADILEQQDIFGFYTKQSSWVMDDVADCPADLYGDMHGLFLPTKPDLHWVGQTQPMPLETTANSPCSFGYARTNADGMIPGLSDCYDPASYQAFESYDRQDAALFISNELSRYQATIVDTNDQELGQVYDVSPKSFGSDYALIEDLEAREAGWTECTKDILERHDRASVLLSSKATDNSEVRVPSQIWSLRDANEPVEAEVVRFSPSIEEGMSLLDCWLAGAGLQFESSTVDDHNCGATYASELSLSLESTPAKASAISIITRSDSKTGSICSFDSRVASGPRQGRKKRSAPTEDSASSTGSSSRSKRTSSSITCPKCSESFTRNFSLNRHLNASCSAEQVRKEIWICGPLSQSDGRQECPVCRRNASDIACTHRMAECWGRTEAGCVTFFRRDALKGHLTDYHNLRDGEVNRLVSQMKDI